jgi:uncharacterized membrane-anchored protein YitT (DUF2179 family)
MNKEKVKDFVIDFLVLLAACCISSFSVVSVMLPNGLTSGGLTGIVRIVQSFVDIDFSILYYCGVVIILLLVLIFLGWKEVKKMLLLSIMYPTVLMVFEHIPFQLLEEKDIILAAVFCGVFSGTYVGLVFWRGYASAGSEAIAKIFKKRLFPTVSMSNVLLVVDAVIIIASAVVFGRNIAMYALITQVIVAKMSETVMYGFASKVVQLKIITNKHEGIISYVLDELERGVSSIDITGEYTQQPFKQLTIFCSIRESHLIKKKIAAIDQKAFVTVTKVEAVWGHGKGFDDLDNVE